MNGMGRFFGLGIHRSTINDLLAKPDCTLESLLDDESLIEELRNSNTGLIDL